MTVPLVVVLGAGASHRSANHFADPLPPLTLDLFEESLYGEQLRRYDLAHQAGRYIAQERRLDDALGLEQALHALRTSSFEHHKQMALAVPLYLQDLLHTVSEQNYTHAFRYDRLIERLLRLDFVCFITLNYDVLLDRRLSALHRLSTFDDYISSDKNWWLIKLHGSVNWYHPTTEWFDPAAPRKGLRWDGEGFECRLPTASLHGLRESRPNGRTQRYPALALPEGPEDRLVLPSKHVMYTRDRLRSAHQIDLLVIGYSGLDTKVLELLSSTERQIRRLTVVDRDLDSAMAVRERLRAAGLVWVWEDISRRDYASWTDEDGLDRLVEEYDGPYSGEF